MEFKELVKGYTKEGKGPEYYPSITIGWNAAIEECAEIVKRHKNSPSIIYWNEACVSIEEEILNLKEDK